MKAECAMKHFSLVKSAFSSRKLFSWNTSDQLHPSSFTASGGHENTILEMQTLYLGFGLFPLADVGISCVPAE